MKDARHDDTAAEARDLVRRAVGDASGLTIKGQIKRAAENLGYLAEAWRVREAWYGRAQRWVGTALRELHERFAAWQNQLTARAGPGTQAKKFAKIRRLLGEVDRELAGIEADVGRHAGPP